jgi:poly(A) polymerase
MQEIWLLQSRFSQRVRKRVFRLLSHPRFRAAFDFLELRLSGTPEVAEDVAFWREAQIQSPEALASRLETTRHSYTDDPSAAPKKRRRYKPRAASPEASP